ncbi:MAG: hypothetical protein NT007_09280 [Candidatus Kapabacteria bacterium]|nr:hypothetical protein [Candidatus Kapabacteria bacterium]
MKKIVKLFAILLIIISVSCKKNPTNPNTSDCKIYGNWNLEYIHGGIANIYRKIPQNESEVINFYPNGDYMSYTNSGNNFTGKFEILKQKTIFDDSLIDVITFNQLTLPATPMPKVIIKLSCDSLILSDNYVDNFYYVYSRIIYKPD